MFRELKMTTLNDSAKQLLLETCSSFPRPTTLLVLPYREKGCKELKWQETTYEQTRTPEYQAKLLEAVTGYLQGPINGKKPFYGGIGVRLGPKSSDLCVIDIDSYEQIEPFLV